MGYLYKIVSFFKIKNIVGKVKLLFLFLLLSGGEVFSQCPTVTNLNQSFCDIQSPTIASLQATNNGGGVAWFATNTSTVPLAPGLGLVNGEDYFADNSSGNCGSRVRVVVTIYSAPTGQNFQGVCVDFPSQATIASLIAVGNNVQWYNVPNGGSPLAPGTVLVPNTIYYANQTNPDTGCQTSRLSVFVSVGVVPVPKGAAVQSFCFNPSSPPTVADLNATGNNNWYLTSSSALPLDMDTPLIDGQTYYATTVDPPCESEERLEVLVSIQPQNNAGSAGTVSFCEDDLSSVNFIDLYSYLGGTPFNTGEWTGPFPTDNGNSGTLDLTQLSLSGSPYVFTYSVSSSTECPTDTATVTITINPIPNAGTDGSITLCETSPVVDLFTLLGNSPETGGSWSPALASGTGVFDPGVDPAGVYVYTLIGTPPCENSTARVTVTVNPTPNPGEAATAVFCANGAPEDLFNSLGGTPDAGGTWSPPLASGTGVFDPTQDTAGTYTYTVSGTAPCTPQSTTVTVTINPIPNAGTDGSITLCETSPVVDLFTLLGNSPETGGSWSPALASGTGVFDPGVDPAGVYVYTLIGTPPCANSTASISITIESTANAGNFTGIQSICASEGTFDLNTLLDGTQQTDGTWTDNQGDTVTNTVIITDLLPGTYTYIYTIVNDCNTDAEVVQFTIIQGSEIAPEDVLVQSPICQGENSTVTIFNLADGNYALIYSLTGSNIFAGQSVLLTVVDGEAGFEIDAAQLANSGITTLTLDSILNTDTNCSTILDGLSFDIEILPALTLTNNDLTIQNVCIGTMVTVQISGATNLADGTYRFVYAIPNANPVNGNSGDVIISGGSGQFTIPDTVFPTAGSYTLTVNAITGEASPCGNLNPAVSVSFEVLPVATLTEALISLSAICANTNGTVLITNATNLSDGTYQVSYLLTGAVSHSETISVVFLNGEGSFIIPSAVLTDSGEVTIAINQINSNTGNACGTSGHTFTPVTLTIETAETPELVEGGNSFCEDDNATIANLSSGINTEQPVTWYDAPVNGNAYADSTVLIDGQVYYASIQSAAGCESIIRLAVTVSIKDCTDIIIPDGFSPNGDGINDFFVIKNIRTLYPNFDLEIFNRYGNVLYKGNAASQDWDGTSDKGIQVGGNKLPVGVYFFIINFNDGIREPLQGRVYLSR